MNIFKAILPFIPAAWKLLSEGSKIAVTTACVLALLAYTAFISWASIRSSSLVAYDDRWYYNYKEAHSHNDAIRVEVVNTLNVIKDTQRAQAQDIRDIRNALMGKRK